MEPIRCRRENQYVENFDGITDQPKQWSRSIELCGNFGANQSDKVQDRTLFVKIHLEEYVISWEVLDQVFSSVGNIEIIKIFDDDDRFHSRIRFQNRESAFMAFNCYNGRCIYDGCCRLELFLDTRSSGRSSDIQTPSEDASEIESPGGQTNPSEETREQICPLESEEMHTMCLMDCRVRKL